LAAIGGATPDGACPRGADRSPRPAKDAGGLRSSTRLAWSLRLGAAAVVSAAAFASFFFLQLRSPPRRYRSGATGLTLSAVAFGARPPFPCHTIFRRDPTSSWIRARAPGLPASILRELTWYSRAAEPRCAWSPIAAGAGSSARAPSWFRCKEPAFDVAWKPDDDLFELRLYEGHVTVSGCVFGDGRPILPGETVRARLRSGHLRTSQHLPRRTRRRAHRISG